MAGVSIAKNALDSFVCSSNEAIDFILVRNEGDLKDKLKVFHPELSHQFFGDNESIFGYKDLCIKLYYSAAKLTTYLGMSYSEKVDPLKYEGVQPDKVLQVIADKLQPGYHSNLDDFVATLAKDANFVPYGELIHSFNISDDATDRQFQIYKADVTTSGFCDYHERMQTFLLWFVDAASYIDVDDNRWHFYVVYERYKNDDTHCYSFAGYSTVYHYYAYPNKIRPRISQMLVLPPFQSKGIGAQLLQSIYCQYSTDDEVLDITVEDPSEAFIRLRDFVDVRNCMSLSSFTANNLKDGFSGLMIKEAQSKLKLSKMQVRRVYEIMRLRVTNTNDEEEYRSYRLEVKRRLNKPYERQKSDLKKLEKTLQPEEYRATVQFANLEQRIGQLGRLYDELENEYRHTLERLDASPKLNE